MTSEERLRGAFRDLTVRVARDIDPSRRNPSMADLATARSQSEPGRPRRPHWPALAVAAGAFAVLLAGGLALAMTRGDDSAIETGPARETTTDTASDTPATTAQPDEQPTTTTPLGTPGVADDVAPETRLRVVTELVLADVNDPFLNVRLDPDPGADLLAKLPATYTGLAATGRTETASDGGDWIQVHLIDPVSVSTVDRETGEPPSGWVNAAFVEALPEWLPVTTQDVPPCTGGFESVDTGGGLRDGYVYALEGAEVRDDCLRVVVTFGRGQAPVDWYDVPVGTGPAVGLPELFVTSSGRYGASLDLVAVEQAWPLATADGGMFVVRQADRSLDLVTTHHVEDVTITGLPDRGMAVIDLRLGTELPPPGGAGIFLTSPVAVGTGSVDVAGIARPFEATLGVSIEDEGGDSEWRRSIRAATSSARSPRPNTGWEQPIGPRRGARSQCEPRDFRPAPTRSC